MDQQLLDSVIERAEISEEQAENAIRAMIDFMEGRLPVGIAAHVSRVADVDAEAEKDEERSSTTQKFSAVTGAFAPEE